MVAAAHPPRRDRLAIAGSIAIHLCVLATWAALPRAPLPADDPDERALLTSVLQIEHRPPPARIRRAQPRHAAPAATPRFAAPSVQAAVTHQRAARKLVVATEHRAASPSKTAVVRRPRSVALAGAPDPARPEPATPAAPSAAPAPPAATPVPAQREEGIGNFGETYPAALDPAARGTLVAWLNGAIVRIAVDENGRATAIEFVRPPPDPAQREELRSRLLAVHFIPAACNGLRCAGSVELRN